MAKTKTKRKSKSKKKKSDGIIKEFATELFAPKYSSVRHGCLYLLIFSGLTVAITAGFGYLEGYVQEVTRQRQVEIEVILTNSQPHWSTESLMKSICQSSGIKSDDDLLNENLVKTGYGNLVKNPWVKKVNLIRKRYDGRIEIDFELREPIAEVAQGSSLYYIDKEGIVMPARQIKGQLVRITGLVAAIPIAGNQVDAPEIMAGLKILDLIRSVDNHPVLPVKDRVWNELARLDVSNYNGRIDSAKSQINLYTKKHNTEIRWGAEVGNERAFYEAGFKVKLTRLYNEFKQYGSLDVFEYVELRELRNDSSDPLRKVEELG